MYELQFIFFGTSDKTFFCFVFDRIELELEPLSDF